MYIEIKAKTEDKRSLKEFIQVKVYEQVDKYLRELEALRLDNDEAARQIQSLTLGRERDARELESLKKAAREREEDFRRK